MAPDKARQAATAASLAAIDVERITRESFERMLGLIRQGVSPQKAIASVTATWSGAYFGVLSDAFSTLLDKSIGTAEVRDHHVGNVELSRVLYDHSRDVNSATAALIRRHARGLADARALGLELFEGYGFNKLGDPLEVTAKLPRYLRELVEDPGLATDLELWIRRGQAQALKTPALRAAYLQAFDAIEGGAGEAALSRKLQIAWFERNRYLANRIAQTELHRTYVGDHMARLIRDPDVVWIQVRMSSTHPRADVCDYHAKLDAYGQGPGIYPKRVVPVPPFHPHCRCRLVERLDLDPEAPTTPDRSASERFFRDLPDDEARQIAGSRDKLARILDGEPPVSVFDDGKNRLYETRVGDEFWSIEPSTLVAADDIGVDITGAKRRGRPPGAKNKTPVAPVTPPPVPVVPPTPVDARMTYAELQALGLDKAFEQIKAVGAAKYDELIGAYEIPANFPVMAFRGRKLADLIAERPAGFDWDDVIPPQATGPAFMGVDVTRIAGDVMGRIREALKVETSAGTVAAQMASGGKGAAAVEKASRIYPASWVERANVMGAANPLHVSYSTRRGSHNAGTWSARLGRHSHIYTDASSTATHEYGHHLQSYVPGLDDLFQFEHRRRTAGEKLARIRDLASNWKAWGAHSGYKAVEVTRKDGYYHVYQGREYVHGASSKSQAGPALEVLTMAFEGLLGFDLGSGSEAARFAKFLLRDPEMVKLTLGILFGYKG